MTAGDHLTRILSGTDQVIPDDGLTEKLALDRPLRVKLGIDPTRPDLHLGHAVVLRKLRQFQDAGHQAVLIIGDFTGLVGDPSGRSETRPMLSADEMEVNARTYLEQAGKILQMDAVEVRRNSEWLASMDMGDVLRLTGSTTVAQMLERDDFSARYKAGQAISVVEFLYPLLQGMDSVRIEADVELGGTDQTFNLLMGRALQREYGQPPQVVLTVPLLEGTDGTRKMSKSYDNYVGLTDPPGEMFGRLMRVPDELIVKYLRLCTALGPDVVDEIEAAVADGSLKPNDAKRRLAREVCDLYHGFGAGGEAERAFDRVHKEHQVPERIPEIDVTWGDVRGDKQADGFLVYHPALLHALGLVSSRSEGRRAIEQAGVRRDGEQVDGLEERLDSPERLKGAVWQVGRRRFARVGDVRWGETS